MTAKTKQLLANNGLLTLESMSQALWYNRWSFELFRPYLKGAILEVGCGIGNFTPMLTGNGKVCAIDIEKSYLKKTRKRVNGKAKVGYGDIEKGKYFFRKKTFDSVICLNVLEHVKNDDTALANIRRLLKHRGILILLVPLHQLLFGAIDQAIGHYRRYEKDSLVTQVKRNGFKIIFLKKINALGALGWWFSGKIMKEAVVSKNKLKLFDLLARLALPLEKNIAPPFGTSILLIAQRR